LSIARARIIRTVNGSVGPWVKWVTFMDGSWLGEMLTHYPPLFYEPSYVTMKHTRKFTLNTHS